MKVLVLSPHPDDDVIGCGGALLRHARARDEITVVFLTSGELGLKRLPAAEARTVREAEARAAAEILGVSQVEFLRRPDWGVAYDVRGAASAMLPLLSSSPPDLCYCPHALDAHPDHQAALPVLWAALNQCGIPSLEVRTYEVWAPLPVFDTVEDISETMDRKIDALRAHLSQRGEFNYERAVRGLNAYRGEFTARVRYAEVFQHVTPP
jgi:LmbE family N-acetylglucosaminyl deacetylase